MCLRSARHIWLSSLLLALVTGSSLRAQSIDVTVTVDRSRPRGSISPWIYGSNGGEDEATARISARRLGGNRLTAYNWENNASNAGRDWFHSSDNYLTWMSGIAPVDEDIPAIVVRAFHDSSIANGAYSLVTLPMAGYVARDKNGGVSESQTAPSSRWVRVVTRKSGTLQEDPDTTDDVVYTDEFLHAMISRYGTARSGNGIRGYALDNEPGLWFDTHPRVHPAKVRVDELFARSVQLAGAVKRMDAGAEVFGPVLYGFNSYLTLQDAPDWPDYSTRYDRFIDAYLDVMKRASDSAGVRLLDVLDVHWYPEPPGVFAGDTSRAVASTRVQLPRSLWDSSYVENSWIGTWFSPVAILPGLQASVARWFPGTSIAITEYSYGAPNHISGGIAQADVLGIFGAHGVHFGALWGSVTGYQAAAFRLFRNFDNTGGRFGDVSISSTVSDPVSTSAWASTRSTSDRTMHLIMLNKHADSTVTAHIRFEDGLRSETVDHWMFHSGSPRIVPAGRNLPVPEGDTFSLDLPPMSAHHLIFSAPVLSSSAPPLPARPRIEVHPNPVTNRMTVDYTVTAHAVSELRIHDVLGRVLLGPVAVSGTGQLHLDVSDWIPGTYLVSLHDGTMVRSTVVRLLR